MLNFNFSILMEPLINERFLDSSIIKERVIYLCGDGVCVCVNVDIVTQQRNFNCLINYWKSLKLYYL